MTGLDQWTAGKTDSFGGPPANGNCRAPRLLSTIIAVGCGFAVVVALVVLGVFGVSIVGMLDSHRPGSMRTMTSPPIDVPITITGGPPPIAAEAPGRTEASCPPASTGLAENAPPPSIVAPVNEAAARVQLTAWWAAAHVPRPHVAHPQHPIWRTPRFPELSQIYAPAARDFGCPPSLGSACAR
jgi:hypothetical protein